MYQLTYHAEVFLKDWNDKILKPINLEPLDIRTNKIFVARNMNNYVSLYEDSRQMLIKLIDYIKGIGANTYWRDNISLITFFSEKFFPTKWEELLSQYDKNIKAGLLYDGTFWINKNSLNNPEMKIVTTSTKAHEITNINPITLIDIARKFARKEITVEQYYKEIQGIKENN